MAVTTMYPIHTKRASIDTMPGMVGLIFCIIFTTSTPPDPYSSNIEPGEIGQARPLNARDDRLIQFDVPAGDLAAAIRCVAEQAQLSLAFDPALTRGKLTNGLAGTFSTAVALEQLVKGAGLQIVPTPAKGYRIESNLPISPKAP
jgi:hypothetical protein